MKKKFYGILSVDYPNLSDSELRQIQLGELDTLPDGKTVAEYTAEVEDLKAENLKREDEKRVLDLKKLAKDQSKTKPKEKEETPAPEPEKVTDSDVVFGPEVKAG